MGLRLVTHRLLVLIAGPPGAGKTFLAHRIRRANIFPATSVISTDWYFHRSIQNYDALESVDTDSLLKDVSKLEDRHTLTVQYKEHSGEGTETLTWTHVLVVEGIYALSIPSLFARADLAIYMTTDLYLAGARRALRDVLIYREEPSTALRRIEEDVVPSIPRLINPQRQLAGFHYGGDGDWPRLCDRLQELQQKKDEHSHA